ncbi:PRA1 family protein F2 [Forsythia ovata]|uniref:PRA1 family protein n=1 Tax=Forsythia ovata TaxID=205694 RepID=A0ABD1PG01_9LAMI
MNLCRTAPAFRIPNSYSPTYNTFHLPSPTTPSSPEMTNYGTIPTSSPAGTASRMEYLARAKERIKEGLGTCRSWREMFVIHAFNLPTSSSDALSRIKTNVVYFQMNYAIIVLSVIFLSLLWHPISLIVLVAITAAWLYLYFLRDEPIVIFGTIITNNNVLIGLSVTTIVLLLLTGAITNILSSLLVGVVVVLIHAAVRKTDDLSIDPEAATGLLRPPASR